MSREEKLDILRRVDKVARAADKRVQEVSASLSGVYELILVAATDGTLAADVRPLVRLSISVQVEDDGKRERGSAAAAVVLAMTGSWATLTVKCAPMRGRKKPCAWRW
jgi:predicted Zn-dependent protease